MISNIKVFPISYRYNLRGFDKVELPNNKIKSLKIERSKI